MSGLDSCQAWGLLGAYLPARIMSAIRAVGCPNALKALLRRPTRDVVWPSSRACTIAVPGTPRWLSCSAPHGLPVSIPRAKTPLATRIRITATSANKSPGSPRTVFSVAVKKRYEDLPRNYSDKTGLPFRDKPLSGEEVGSIFGPSEISVKDANSLLRILHGRRVAGTLKDPAFYGNTAQFARRKIQKALVYLRATIPVEEVRNAGLRAEDELNEMDRKEERQKTQKGSVSKDEELEDEEDDPVYGRSALAEVRARNKALQKAQETAQQAAMEAKKAKEAEARKNEPPGSLVVVDGQEVRLSNPRTAKLYLEATSGIKEVPEMSVAERILPSVVVVLLAVGFMAAVALVYEDPATRHRLFPDIRASTATLTVLVGLNALVWILWKVPVAWKFLNRNMIMVVALPRPLSMFLSAFSHQTFFHLLPNMVILWFLGQSLHDEIGRANFLALFISCGALSQLSSLVGHGVRGALYTTSLGASGAVLGICTAYLWEHRMDGFTFFGLPDNGVHGIVALATVVGLQISLLWWTKGHTVDMASHIGGMLAGGLGIELINRAGQNKDLEWRRKRALAREKQRRELLEQQQQQQKKTETTTTQGNDDTHTRTVIDCTAWLRPNDEPSSGGAEQQVATRGHPSPSNRPE